jgi:hypothetical protein
VGWRQKLDWILQYTKGKGCRAKILKLTFTKVSMIFGDIGMTSALVICTEQAY